jgi:hypothetical protein
LYFVTLVVADYGPIKIQNNNSEYYAFTILPPVLSDGLNISLNAPLECPFQLCLTYLIGVPNNTLTSWPTICKFYKQINGSDTVTFFNQPGVYQGLVYLNPRSPNNCSFEITFQGTICGAGTFGKQCSITPKTFPLTSTLDSNEEIYFLSNLTSSNIQNFSVIANVSNDQNGSLVLSYREGDVPRQGVMDNSTTTELQDILLYLPLPRETNTPEFSKLFSLRNNGLNSVTVSINVAQQQCRSPFYGPDCQTEVATCDRGKTYTIDPVSIKKGWFYCSVDFSKVEYFNIGVTSLDSGFSPQLYVRYGSIPSTYQYDAFSNDSTKDPRFYFSGQNVPTEGLWYVGVYGATTTFGLWFEDDCPSECSGSGKCENHKCICADGFTFFDCSQKTSDPTSDPSKSNLYLIIGATGAGVVLLILIFFYYRHTTKTRRTRGYEYLGAHKEPVHAVKDRTYDSLTIGSL